MTRPPERHVNDLLGKGASLGEIEDFIERQSIPEEDRAVLWLRAWAERSDVGRLRRRSLRHPHPYALKALRG